MVQVLGSIDPPVGLAQNSVSLCLNFIDIDLVISTISFIIEVFYYWMAFIKLSTS